MRVFDGLISETSAEAALTVPEPSSPALFLAVCLAVGWCLWRHPSRASSRRLLSPAMIAVIVSLVPVEPARAILNLTGNFDHGSLQSWSGDLNQIQLIGRENHPTTSGWRWLYFQASGIDGAQPTFSIDQTFVGSNSALNQHEMVYSYDNENWFFFENNQRSGTNFTFSNNSSFTQDDVYVAYAQPYSYGRSAAHASQVLATPWAESTVSGDANGVIGETPIAFDDLGRLNPKRDIFAYRITNPATDSTVHAKHKVVLATSVHAGEVLGTHTFEGLINWLVSDDARAARLRDNAEFFAYPIINAAGRFAGTCRATVENPNEDPNRIWHPSLWGSHQDIRASGEAMMADVQSTPGSEVDAFIDFHSTIPSSEGDDFGYIEISEGDAEAGFWQALRALQPNVLQVESTGTNWTTANFGDVLLNADVDITFETQFGKSRPLSYYHTLGANFGIAFYQDWIQVADPLAADFDEDGDVDAVDLGTWQQQFGRTGDVEHYQGDADGDQDTDGADLLAWQRQFGQSNLAGAGNGAPASGLPIAVPEPGTLLVFLLAWVLYPLGARSISHTTTGQPTESIRSPTRGDVALHGSVAVGSR